LQGGDHPVAQGNYGMVNVINQVGSTAQHRMGGFKYSLNRIFAFIEMQEGKNTNGENSTAESNCQYFLFLQQ